MTDDTPLDFPGGLDTALRDRVADEHPDLDRLIGVSTRGGTRMRRRRAALTTVAGVAATVTVVGIVGASLGGAGGTKGSEPGLAAEPTSAPTASTSATPTEAPVAPSADAPIVVDAPGWTCDPFMDDKLGCTRNGAVVGVALRKAREHDAYLDPGKADVMPGIHTFVGPVHGHRFVTVSPGVGATQQDVDDVAAGLSWVR